MATPPDTRARSRPRPPSTSPRPPAGVPTPTRSPRVASSPARREHAVRGPPHQLQRPVRPAARPDRQAQARHHRGRAGAGHRRVHRHIRARPEKQWDLGQASEFLVIAATLLDLKAARLLPRRPEDAEDLELLEARDLLFARLLQYRAYKVVAARSRSGSPPRAAASPAWSPSSRTWRRCCRSWSGRSGPSSWPLAARAAQGGAGRRHQPPARAGGQRPGAGRGRVDRLRHGGSMSFRALTADADATIVVVARFLALLELFREGAVAFDQVTPLGELTVRWTAGTARRGCDDRGVRRLRRARRDGRAGMSTGTGVPGHARAPTADGTAAAPSMRRRTCRGSRPARVRRRRPARRCAGRARGGAHGRRRADAAVRLAPLRCRCPGRVEALLDDLARRVRRAGARLRGARRAGGWRIYSAPVYADVVGRFVLEGQTARLTQAALETLAVIAYRQPVTRGQVSRGPRRQRRRRRAHPHHPRAGRRGGDRSRQRCGPVPDHGILLGADGAVQPGRDAPARALPAGHRRFDGVDRAR